MGSRLSGRLLSLSIPFEELTPGPHGELVQVIDYDAARDMWYSPVNLDDPPVLAEAGLQPSESDPRSHQQMVYAVAMSVIERFQRFTGRRFRWRGSDCLKIVPHAFYGRNAYFDPSRGAVLFGYFRADESDSDANLPGQLMFTCLSVDIVAHEVTHAIVHRVRELFEIATNPDVYAFHEGFADLIALFHHFLFREVVESAVADSRSELGDARALFALAEEFGKSTGRGGPLRSALADSGSQLDPRKFLDSREPHERGAIFVAAVFDAFLDTFKAQIADLRRLATGGSGVLGAGELTPDLVHRISSEATKNADRVLGMVVRAFDYLPPVDVEFGDVVRAIITADRDLFPEDTIRLRGRLVESLRERGIFPPGVVSLADQALIWKRPVRRLCFAEGDVPIDLSQLILESTVKLDQRADSDLVSSQEARARSDALFVQARSWGRAHAWELGLDPTAGRVDVQGMHVAFHAAADGQPSPMIFAQFVQRRLDLEIGADPNERTKMYAGCTLIASVDGTVKYVIPKPFPMRDEHALSELPEPVRTFAQEQHGAGQRRLAAIRSWFDEVEDADPLAIWLPTPAEGRLTFAGLHAPEEEVSA